MVWACRKVYRTYRRGTLVDEWGFKCSFMVILQHGGGTVQFPITTSFSCSNLNQSDQIIHSLNNWIQMKHIPDETSPQNDMKLLFFWLEPKSPLVRPSPWDHCGSNRLVNRQRNS
jgi:hypothetical protein